METAVQKTGLLRVTGNLFRCNAFPAHPEEAPSFQAPSRSPVALHSGPSGLLLTAGALREALEGLELVVDAMAQERAQHAGAR